MIRLSKLVAENFRRPSYNSFWIKQNQIRTFATPGGPGGGGPLGGGPGGPGGDGG